MPAESEPQRRAAGAALAVKKGERPASSLKGAARGMLSMTRSQLEDFARSPNKPQTTRAAAHLDREHKAMRGASPQSSRKKPKSKRPRSKGRS